VFGDMSGGLRQFRLPDLGEGLTEAEIVTWLVAVGDEVALNQVLAEVETEKAVVELPSPYAGTVRELLAMPGETVSVGDPIIGIGTTETTDTTDTANTAGTEVAPGAHAAHDAEAAGDTQTAPATSGPTVPSDDRVPMLVGTGPSPSAPSRRRRTGRHRPGRATEPSPSPSPSSPSSSPRPLAAPPVRFMARQFGVDLREVVGHGPGGIITRDDLAAHLARADGSGAPADTERTGETRSPIRGVQKAMADAMARSAAVPQACVFLTVDVTPTVELVEHLRTTPRFAGVRLTPLAVVARAMVVALREHGALNAAFDESTGEVVTRHAVHLGVAVAGPRGLVVPNVKDSHAMSLLELARALAALAVGARDSTCTPADLHGGTITLTNVGTFGVDGGMPLLNPGEAAILALGAIARRPWEHEGMVALREVVTLSLTFDHRIVDGEAASRFLRAIGEILADPTTLLAFA
jgi:2-oxoisovalerate dehydrogenase E2 component (dihydrolipoyl transacylase)